MIKGNEFEKFAVGHLGMSSAKIHGYQSMMNKSLYPMASRITPNIAEERKLNVSILDVYSRLMMDRIIYFITDVNDDVAGIVQAQLLFLANSDPDSDITIYLSSPGGSVVAGNSMIDTMQFINNDVSVINVGMAASMGAMILSSGTKGKRFGLKHSKVMIHQPLGNTGYGQSSDIEIYTTEMLKTKKELYQMLVENTGKSYEQIEKDCDRNYWLNGQEAKEYGLIDDVLLKATEPKKGKK